MNHSLWFLLCLGKASAPTQESVAWTKERRSKMIPETTRFWPRVCVKTPSYCYFELSGTHSFQALVFQTLRQSARRLGREKDLCVVDQAILWESWGFLFVLFQRKN